MRARQKTRSSFIFVNANVLVEQRSSHALHLRRGGQHLQTYEINRGYPFALFRPIYHLFFQVLICTFGYNASS